MSVPSIRPTEDIVEEFGVSKRYLVVLLVLGGVIIIATIILWLLFREPLAEFANSLGVLGPLIVGSILLFPVLLALYIFVRAAIIKYSYEYYLTNQRVIERVGIFSQRTVSADYKNITDLVVSQDLIGRVLLGTGTLSVNTAGGPKEEVILVHVEDPNARREQLRELARAAHDGKKITAQLVRSLDPDHANGRGQEQPTDATSSSPPQEQQGDAAREAKAEAAPSPRGEREQPLRPPVASSPPTESIEADEHIEDLRGDGIDESDRIRHAQKKL